ncbi:unnamed protein product [Prunus armeniaca]
MTSPLMISTHGRDCTYCGDPRHTRETCFKLHGYPKWWATLKHRTQRNTTSNGTSYGSHTSYKSDSTSWIIDSGATDHMMFDHDDFLNTTQLRRTCIANTNEVIYPVIGVDRYHTKEILGRGTKRGELYYVDNFSPDMANSVTHPSDSFKDFDFTCNTCILAKSHCVPYPLSTNKYTTPFTLIHFDVWGLSPIIAPSGVRWFVTFMKTEFNAQIQILHSDNGGEFVNHNFQAYFQPHGIIHETTCPQTPQQNGVAEQKNRHLLETTKAFLIGTYVSRHHWDDAIFTAVHLIIRMHSSVLTFKTFL